MSVRAKFKVDKIDRQSHNVAVKNPDGTYAKDEKTGAYLYEKKEMRSVYLTPVYSDEPGSENKKYWDASPSGSLQLGTINPEAWKQFELDKEYYIDFTPVE